MFAKKKTVSTQVGLFEDQFGSIFMAKFSFLGLFSKHLLGNLFFEKFAKIRFIKNI
jgi:hypothetical protein